MVDNTASGSVGFIDNVKHYLNPSVLWEKIKESKSLIGDLLLFFCIGFLIGYILKKYGQYVAVFLVYLGCMVLLHQCGVIYVTINWPIIQKFLGISHLPIAQGSTFILWCWEWVKVNVAITFSFALGFLGGLRVGQ